MIYMLGDRVTKTSGIADLYSSVPPKSQYYNAAGALQFEFDAGASYLQYRDKATITYTRKRKTWHSQQSNFCLHTKNSVRSTEGPYAAHKVLDIRPGFAGNYYLYYGGHTLNAAAHDLAVTAAYSAFGVTTGSNKLAAGAGGYISEGFSKVRPDLTTVSVPNFIIDIAQLKALFKLWSRNLSLAKNLAGAHLNYKFGWKPTVGDVRAMLNAVISLEAKLKEFKEQCGVLQERNFLNERQSLQKSGTFNMGGDPAYFVEWRAILQSVVQSHFKFIPRPLLALGGIDIQLRGYIDTLGFELNPGILWDAIPFSFVVDWFLNVGDFLNGIKIDALELPIELVDSAVSYKEIVEVGSNLTINPSSHPGSTAPDKYDTRVTKQTLFNRLPLDPDTALLQSLHWKRPTTGQALLGLSLATVLEVPGKLSGWLL